MRALNIFLLALGILFLGCQTSESEPSDNKLGDISIDVTGDESAIPIFEEGLMLLHSFEFKDAADKFKEAQEIDPDFAMAYWGEAMTENHPLWREQEFDKANDILSRLGETPQEQRLKFKTDLEKDFFDAISMLYGEGTKAERDNAYSLKMSQLHKKYPDNHEISAFYALSVLGAVKGKRDYEAYGKAARIAQGIISENPNHPGALHYLIHSYDDPENAPKALEAANSYAKIAPEANHALHMPSHIYVAMGMWDDVISSNKAAVAASKKRKERKDLDNDAIDYHSLKWLMYAHMQRGQFDIAREFVAEMESYCLEDPSPRAKSHNVMMKAAYFTETGDWADPMVLDTVDYSTIPIQIFAAHSYLKGRYYLDKNDAKGLENVIDILEEKVKGTTKDLLIGNPVMCSGSYSRGRPTQLHVDRATVMLTELKAHQAIANNKIAQAENFMKEAIALENQTSYMYGPPDIVKPSNELYAEFLTEQGRLKEAKKYFQAVLERAPKRYIAVNGIKTVDDAIGV